MLLAAKQAGTWATKLKLPLITGFLLMGMVAGPYGLEVISESALAPLRFIDHLALAFIAFAAGNELNLKELRHRWQSIGWVTAGLVGATFILTSLAVWGCTRYMPFLNEATPGARVAVAILAGSILVARSPSSAIAIVSELRARGPFTQTMLGVTVIMDVVVILLFGLNMEIADILLRSPELRIGFILLILVELAISGGVGYLLGRGIGFLLTLRWPQWVRAGLILGLGYGIFVGSDWLRAVTLARFGLEVLLEPLLICVVAGFVVANRTAAWNQFSEVLARMGPGIYLAFFTFTGASLALDVLVQMWPVALVLSLVRLVAIMIGSYCGGYLAGDEQQRRGISWMGYITQAGIGLGLAKEVAGEFPEIGSAFATVIIAVIILNQIMGPPLLKFAIHKTGEAYKASDGKEASGGSHRAVIFGLEEQAIALATLLRQHQWEVAIASRRTHPAGAPKTPAGAELNQIPDLEATTFRRLGIDTADAVVALLSDAENLRVCESVRQISPRTNLVVRLNERKNLRDFQPFQAAIVDPDTALTQLLEQYVRLPSTVSLLLGSEAGRQIEELEVRNPMLHGLLLRDLHLPLDCFCVSMKREGRRIVLHGYNRIQLGDQLTIGGSPRHLAELAYQFGNSNYSQP